jgi:hypothetical protein
MTYHGTRDRRLVSRLGKSSGVLELVCIHTTHVPTENSHTHLISLNFVCTGPICTIKPAQQPSAL